MEAVQKKWWVVCVVFLVLLSVKYGARAQQVPCYFIFGDSLVDNGNNNQLSSLAKANYMPYGIDFPRGPTGRFSNGRTTVDVIGKSQLSLPLTTCYSYFPYMQLTDAATFLTAEQLGFRNYIPPYATARGRDILGGVNYASAAAGIREETGRQLVIINQLLIR
jgi:hypothetical protein